MLMDNCRGWIKWKEACGDSQLSFHGHQRNTAQGTKCNNIASSRSIGYNNMRILYRCRYFASVISQFLYFRIQRWKI